MFSGGWFTFWAIRLFFWKDTSNLFIGSYSGLYRYTMRITFTEYERSIL